MILAFGIALGVLTIVQLWTGKSWSKFGRGGWGEAFPRKHRPKFFWFFVAATGGLSLFQLALGLSLIFQ